MSIREELREMYQRRQANWKTYHQDVNKTMDIDEQARSFIEKNLVYKFKEIFIKKEKCDYIYIEYDYGKEWIWYLSNIDPILNMGKKPPIPKEVMERVVELAQSEEYDIGVDRDDYEDGSTKYLFYIELS